MKKSELKKIIRETVDEGLAGGKADKKLVDNVMKASTVLSAALFKMGNAKDTEAAKIGEKLYREYMKSIHKKLIAFGDLVY